MEATEVESLMNLIPKERRDLFRQQLQRKAKPGSGCMGPVRRLSQAVSVMPGAAHLNGAVYTTAILSGAELPENAMGAGAHTFQMYIVPMAGKQVRRPVAPRASSRPRLRRPRARRCWCLRTTATA
jgi:hypothetical protein